MAIQAASKKVGGEKKPKDGGKSSFKKPSPPVSSKAAAVVEKKEAPADQPKAPEQAKPVVKLGEQQIAEGLTAFSKLLELRDADAKKDLLGAVSGEGRKVQLQVAGIKLPRVNEAQILKIRLPHPHTPDTRDVCLIVKDLEKGIRPDHEETVRQAEALLVEKGVQGVTKVIAFRELKVEYKTFEAKTALCHLYEHFLVDQRIIRLVPKFLGKPFYKRRKFPVGVDLTSRDLPAEVQRAVGTACLALTHQGTSSTLTVGRASMPQDQLRANLAAAVAALETKYPGGWTNIRALHLLSGTTSLPLYVTLRATQEVGMVHGLKRKSKGVVVGELSTVVGATVTVTPTGGVRLKRTKDPLWTEDEETQEVTNEVAEAGTDGQGEKKKAKSEPKKVTPAADEDDSEDEMEDKETAYMQKVADEEEEMERKLEETEDKLEEERKTSNVEESKEEDDEADDDAEAENLLSEGEDSDSEDELIMKQPEAEDDNDDDEDVSPAKKPKTSKGKLKAQAKKEKTVKKPETKKTQKQKKFVEQKKKAKLAKGKK
jgi:ribosome biogenesis protein UTP30